MLKRVSIKNFLSLEDVDLDLRARNVLVGPNMSGKSNLIECFKFLRDCIQRSAKPGVTSFHRAIVERGGFPELVWRGRTEKQVTIDVSAELDHRPSNERALYRYLFVFATNDFLSPEVALERLTRLQGGKEEILLENSPSGIKVTGRENLGGAQNTLGLALEMWGQSDPSLKAFVEFVAGWQVYRMLPALMRTGNSASRAERLSEYAENLTAWLFELQSHPREFDAIKRVARDALPGLEEILFQWETSSNSFAQPQGQIALLPEPAKISVGASEKLLHRPVSLARMSDGELAFLALISLILAPAELQPTLLLIEEPENYLHPRLMEILVDLLDQQAVRGSLPQIVATTHSLPFVDRLKIEDLIVAGKKDGATRFTRPANNRHLKKLLSSKESSLGDLLYSGALSDN